MASGPGVLENDDIHMMTKKSSYSVPDHRGYPFKILKRKLDIWGCELLNSKLWQEVDQASERPNWEVSRHLCPGEVDCGTTFSRHGLSH